MYDCALSPILVHLATTLLRQHVNTFSIFKINIRLAKVICFVALNMFNWALQHEFFFEIF